MPPDCTICYGRALHPARRALGVPNGADIDSSPPCWTYTWTGSATSASAFVGGPPLLGIVINVSNNTFALPTAALVPGSLISKNCDGTTESKPHYPFPLGPSVTSSAGAIVNPFPFLALPQTVQTLQQTISFNAPAVAFGGSVPATWTLSFKLVPVRGWVRAWMSGGNNNQITTRKETR